MPTLPERTYDKIKVAKHGALHRIVLDYPRRRNAIGPQMANELLWALADAQADEEIRIIVLAAEGRAFCAGGDFAQMTGAEEDPNALPTKGDYADLILAMVRSEKPIIARVHGPAMGGGLGLVAASTLAVASDDAVLGTPEVDVGLFPMMIMAVLSRLVPRRRLLEMMLTGERLKARDALELGILNRVVPPSELDAAVQSLTREIGSKSPRTIALGLRAFNAQDDMDLERSLPMLRERLAECLATEDAQEGLTAYLEKRPPVWRGR